MPDSIDIKVSITGNAEIDALIAKLKQGQGTLNDLTQVKKAMNAAFKDTQFGTEKYTEYSKSLAAINDRQRDVRIETKAGHEAYFKAGLELRQLLLSTQGASGGMGTFVNIMSSSVLNAVQLKTALVPLGIQMSMMGIGIASVVGIGASLISYFVSQSEKADQAKEEMAKYRQGLADTTMELKKLRDEEKSRSDQQDKDIERSARAAKVNELIARSAKILNDQYLLTKGARTAAGNVIFGAMSEENQKKYLEFQDQLIKNEKEIASLGVEQAKQIREESPYIPGKYFGTFAERMTLPPPPTGIVSRFRLSGQYKGLFGAGASFKSPLADSFGNLPTITEEVKDKATGIAQALERGAKRFSDTLLNALIEGRNIANSIGMALLGILVDVGSSYLTGGLTNVIKGLPWGGRPSINPTGSPVLAAENSSFRSPFTSFSQPQLVARVSGPDLLVMLANAGPVLRGRTY